MPELPDIELYREALRARIDGRVLEGMVLHSPFLVRTVAPPPGEVIGRRVVGIERLGKRLVLAFEDELFLLLHLMIAGRLQWSAPGRSRGGRQLLATFTFENGILLLTEAGSRRRASLHVIHGREGLRALDPGGLEVDALDLDGFHAVLTRERHTLKRALTDPRLLSGIGNAYSDEILHEARLSPLRMTDRLTPEEVQRLFEATRTTLRTWTRRLIEEAGGEFPAKVTAFRPGMAVHGRYGQPCPRCGTPIQRLVAGEHEANYCPTCQTGGRLLADRGLSRLLREDWPRTLEELEERRAALAGPGAGGRPVDPGHERRGRRRAIRGVKG